MAYMLELAETADFNPLDAVEDFADANEWPSERSSAEK